MLDKLELIKERFEDVGRLLVQPDIVTDMKRYSALNKEYKDLGKIVEVFDEYKDLLDKVAQAKNIFEINKKNRRDIFLYIQKTSFIYTNI